MGRHRWKAGGGALGPLVLGVALVMAGPAPARPVDRWSGFIAEASARFGVPEDWIRRVMLAESGGRASRDGRPITSRAGAMGLMQLMPGTWNDMRAAHALGADPHDPRDNIIAGTAYLRVTHDRFGYPGLFAAYNAGPARYANHLATGRRLPAETVAYAAAVSGRPTRRGTPAGPARGSGIFVALFRAPDLETAPRRAEAAPPPAAGSLFVPLRMASAPSS